MWHIFICGVYSGAGSVGQKIMKLLLSIFDLKKKNYLSFPPPPLIVKEKITENLN